MTDDAVRARIRADLASTLFVEAGDGTGKTTTLVARILEAVTTGALAIHQLAAITFTESAAGELRDRITLALERAAHEDATVQARERAQHALAGLDDATITTIHGFAQRICAEWAPVAGLPPGFEVRDDIGASVAFEAAWQRFLDDWYADPDAADLLQIATVLGATPHHFREIAVALYAHADRLSDASMRTVPLPAIEFQPLLRALEAVCVRAGECNEPSDLLALHLAKLAVFTARFRDVAANDPFDALDILMRAPTITSTRGRAATWVDKGSVLDELTACDATRVATLAPLRAAVVRNVAARIAAFTRAQADERIRNGTLEFDDLLRVARDLLRDHPELRAAIADRWQLLAIDEFQDTDPLQVDIALLLADAEAASVERAHWGDLAPAGGRLFLVGDPKQSIYRFRRADLALYRSVVTTVPGDAVALDRNFRTVAPVIDWVNEVVAILMAERGPIQAPWRDLIPHREMLPGDAGPPVTILGGARGGPKTGVSTDDIRGLEATTIAAAISNMRAHGWQVCDPLTDTWRPARLSDIAILVPTRASVSALERALEDAGLPLRIESRSLLWDSAEVHDVLLLLRAIDDPADELAVVGALRSPAFGCTDRELLEFVRAGGRFVGPPRPVDPSTHGTILDSLAWIHARHNERWWTPINQVVERCLRERHAFAVALTTPRARDRWRRLRFVLDQARAFDEHGGVSLGAFLAWVDEQRRHGAQVHDAIAPDSDDDAVRLMTAHAAKGLEFPIVVLAGWNQQHTDAAGPVLWNTVHSAAFEVRVGARGLELTTGGYDGLLPPEVDELRAERDRLLYVAATRARDHLLVSVFHKAGTTCDAARLAEALDQCDRMTPMWDETLDVLPHPAPPVAGGATAPFDADEWIATRRALIADASRPRVVAATGLTQLLTDFASPDTITDEANDSTTPWRRGRAGTAIGRAVHAVLQTVDFTDAHDLDTLATAHAIAEGVPGLSTDIAKLARSALAAPVMQQARAADRVWREIPVGAPVGDMVLEGYIDLCFSTPDGLVVVDYKTDAVSGTEAMDEAIARYGPQVAAYAAALETILDAPVAACVLVFCRPGTAVEVKVDDLPGAIARVAAALTTRS